MRETGQGQGVPTARTKPVDSLQIGSAYEWAREEEEVLELTGRRLVGN